MITYYKCSAYNSTKQKFHVHVIQARGFDMKLVQKSVGSYKACKPTLWSDLKLWRKSNLFFCSKQYL